uniref:Fatty acyl-CoA reductase n=1 Tax=Timema californicum TaxID=61474 RepID=A0A7R9IZD3_TIMCA|nr:unnamed protein product [Timema californicum]
MGGNTQPPQKIILINHEISLRRMCGDHMVVIIDKQDAGLKRVTYLVRIWVHLVKCGTSSTSPSTDGKERDAYPFLSSSLSHVLTCIGGYVGKDVSFAVDWEARLKPKLGALWDNFSSMISAMAVEEIHLERCVPEIFQGQSVLVTGATGFMGKVLVEKLLRSCSDIKHIYLLMRAKQKQELEDRFKEFTSNRVFDRLREEGNINSLEKLIPLDADLTQTGLGLSNDDTATLMANVSFIFHCAATVRFDEPLRHAVLLNTRGTLELTRLAANMNNLQAFVHVSTAFSNPDRLLVEEIVYPPPADYQQVIQLVEQLDQETLQPLEQQLLKNLPNTYVFSKALAEQVIYDQKGLLPAAIFRPSVVCPSLHEPVPGWVDSYNGPMGILVGASTGVLRSVRGDGNRRIDLLPVDIAINAMISVAWNTANNKCKSIPVYNCTTSSEMSITWNQFLELGRLEYMQCPSLDVIWYPGGSMHSSLLVHLVCFMCLQMIPAIIFDAALFFSRRKPWLVRLQKKIYNILKTVEFFVMNEWTFKNTNLRHLLTQLPPKDRDTFNFDAANIDVEEYVKNWSCVLVTGATGFVGKALVEKLLRSCPEMATIYLLIRPKRGLDVPTRHKELMKHPVFDRIRSECPSVLHKVVSIQGDVTEPDLALSEADRLELATKVNVVFHSAATVRFNESLKVAVNLNTLGTQRVIQLCRDMHKLQAFVHVSTAYSNADKKDVHEVVYPPPANPESVIQCCQTLSDDALEIVAERLRGKHPNTYTLTKALAEWVVAEQADDIPTAIVRPSIVTAAWREPVPGWVDNVCGITGIMMEIGRGTIRSIICNQDLIMDLIPVDFVVNTLITVAWHTATYRPNTLRVYNCTSGGMNPVRWEEFGQLTHRHACI